MPATNDVVLYWGETIGFWIQTVAFVFSAVGAILIIYRNDRQARKRATIDLVLHNNTNTELNEAKKKIASYHAAGTNLSQYACKDLSEKPESQYMMTLLNNYEFIASGIKEGAFDEDIYKRMNRSVLIRDWEAMNSFVVELRKIFKKDTIYSEFEWLNNKWKNSEIPKKPTILNLFT